MSQNETELNDKDNVIQMPARHSKRLLYKDHLARRRTAVAGSTVAFLAIFSFLNHMVWQGSSEEGLSRGVANVQSNLASLYNEEFQQSLVKKLSNSDSVSLGRSPSSIESIKYGELQGSYHLDVRAKKIWSLNKKGDSDEAIGLKKSALEFLISYHSQIPVKYDRVDKLSKQVQDTGSTLENYQLVQNGKPIAKVEFITNAYGILESYVIKQ
ncbi:MAG: hypothetical protein AB8E15_02230 [Bdellovibrionales bacterium]